jgi:hypothetical protein
MIRHYYKGNAQFRLWGTEAVHTIRVRLSGKTYIEDGELFYDYTDFFGVQIGPCSFLWTNPFVKDD